MNKQIYQERYRHRTLNIDVLNDMLKINTDVLDKKYFKNINIFCPLLLHGFLFFNLLTNIDDDNYHLTGVF